MTATLTREMDPRILDRRVEVQREHQRRRFLRLALLVTAAVAICAALGLMRSSLLDVDRVVVSGADRTSTEAIVEAGGIDSSDAMFEADLGAAAASIEALPWVAEADVWREWPATVRVAVRERVPLAAVPGPDGAWVLVDADRHVLSAVSDPSERWVRVEGAPPAGAPGSQVDAVTGEALSVAGALDQETRSNLDRLVVTGTGSLDLRLASGPVVRLGSGRQLEEKLVALRTVFQRVDSCGIATVDVRVPTAPVVTRVPGCQAGVADDPARVDG